MDESTLRRLLLDESAGAGEPGALPDEVRRRVSRRRGRRQATAAALSLLLVGGASVGVAAVASDRENNARLDVASPPSAAATGDAGTCTDLLKLPSKTLLKLPTKTVSGDAAVSGCRLLLIPTPGSADTSVPPPRVWADWVLADFSADGTVTSGKVVGAYTPVDVATVGEHWYVATLEDDDGPSLFTSRDSGATWARTGVPPELTSIHALFASGPRLLVGGGSASGPGIYATEDGGRTWTRNLNRLSLVGERPVSYLAESAGRSYAVLGSPGSTDPPRVLVGTPAGYRQSALLPAGSIMRSLSASRRGAVLCVSNMESDIFELFLVDHQARVRPVQLPNDHQCSSTAFSADGQTGLMLTVALGGQELLTSSDAGESWRPYQIPPPREPIDGEILVYGDGAAFLIGETSVRRLPLP